MERSVKGKAKLGDANGRKEQKIEKRLCVSKLADLHAKRIASLSLVAKPPHLPTPPLFLYSWLLVCMGRCSFIELWYVYELQCFLEMDSFECASSFFSSFV